jgi:hypothetical protein
MPIPSIKEIFGLIKTGATIEAQEKIMELREGAMELQEENLALRERVKLLEIESNQKKSLKHERALYWMADDTVPFCPHCYETDGKLIHMFGPYNASADGKQKRYACQRCFHDFHCREEGAFHANLNIDRRYQATRKL